MTPSVDATGDDVGKVLNELSRLRLALVGTPLAIPPTMHSMNMIRLVSNISRDHKAEVRAASISATANLPDVPKVAGLLESAVTAARGDAMKDARPTATPNYRAMLAKELGVDEGALQALVAAARRNGGNSNRPEKKCDQCGIYHGGTCFAKILADGGTPPGFDKKSADQQARLRARADEIKTLGPFHQRHFAAVAASGNYRSGLLEMHDLHGMLEMHVDSQAGAGGVYHFIRDKSLFVDLDTDAPQHTIDGIGDAVCKSEGVGTVGVKSQGMTIYFRNCLYIPTLGYNLLSTDALYNNSGTKTFLNGDKTIELAGGGTLHMSHCNTFLVTPLPADAVVQQHVLATFVTRGKDGPTHIDANPLSAKDELEFRLWSARLNDPAPARLRAVHEVLDNVPGVLRKANMNNTATDARMLANAPAMATHRRATP